MHRDSSIETMRLVSSVDRVLAEYDYHHDESELRRELMSLIADHAVVISVHIDSIRAYVLQTGRFLSANSHSVSRPVGVR
jgi:hypothetical protein